MDNYEASQRIIEEVLAEVSGKYTHDWQATRIAAALDEVHLIAGDEEALPTFTGVLWGGDGYYVYLNGRRVSQGDALRDEAEHRLAMKLDALAEQA